MNGWTAAQLANLLGGEWRHSPASHWHADHFSINRANMTSNTVFIAIDPDTWVRGTGNSGLYTEWTDGHEILKTMGDSVHGAIVQRYIPELHPCNPQLVVNNSYDVIKTLATQARGRMTGTICAVTGTVGKSTTKEMLALMLSETGPVITTNDNHNSRTGVALAMANCVKNPDFCVLEVAASALWMRQGGICTWVKPDLCIITSIGYSQMGHVKTLREIACIKARICNGIRPGGNVILYRDMEEFGTVLEAVREYGARPITYGWTTNCDAHVLGFRYVDGLTMVRASILGQELTYTLTTYGRPSVINSLAALTAVKLLGLDADKLSKQLTYYRGKRAMLKPVLMSGPNKRITVLDDSYNAEILSMKSAFDAFREFYEQAPQPKGRRIAILGDIVNLADQSRRLHQSLAEPLIASGVDRVFLLGSHIKALSDHLPTGMTGGCFDNAQSCVESVKNRLEDGDFILIKGSRRGCDFGEIRNLLQRGIEEGL